VHYRTIQINHQPDVTIFQFITKPRTQHDYHHDTKVKPEAATAVIELLIMGGETPETCWAVNRRQDNKLKIVAWGWWFIWIKCKTSVPKGQEVAQIRKTYFLHFEGLKSDAASYPRGTDFSELMCLRSKARQVNTCIRINGPSES